MPWIVNPTPWPDMFDFLLGDDVRRSDVARFEGAPRYRSARRARHQRREASRQSSPSAVRALTVPKLVIDHHQPSDDPAGPMIVSDTTACATAELVYDLATVMGWEITPGHRAIALHRHAHGHGRLPIQQHVAALSVGGGGNCSRCGVDPEEMYTRIYASAPAGRVRLMAEVLGTLQVDEAHGLSWLTMRRRRAGAARGEVRGSRRHRRARALDRGDADGAVLPRPRARQGEGVVPQRGRNGRQRLRAQVRWWRTREGVGGDAAGHARRGAGHRGGGRAGDAHVGDRRLRPLAVDGYPSGMPSTLQERTRASRCPDSGIRAPAPICSARSRCATSRRRPRAACGSRCCSARRTIPRSRRRCGRRSSRCRA